MTNYKEIVRAEYLAGSWCFGTNDPAQGDIKFDQALMDVTAYGRTFVEGFVKSVHGVDLERVSGLGVRTQGDIGISGGHRLSPTGRRRVRLMPDGRIEDVRGGQ